MLAWLHPTALAGLIAAAGPIAVHLLRRHRADRVRFPSLRFVRAAATAAVRLHLPSDIRLLILRVAIICAAAMALAQPLFLTTARRAAWNQRISRAIVVDTSASVARGARQREEAATAEARGAAHSVRIDADRLGDGLDRAVTALAATPPSRQEIVVISDLQQDSLTSADVARVPPGIGLRFVAVDALPRTETFRGETAEGAPGIRARVQEIHVMPDATAVRFTPVDAPEGGLRLLNAGAAADALLRIVARAGAPAPSAEQPLAVSFAANPANPTNPILLPWMLRTILAMRRDTLLADAARDHRRQGTIPGSPWIDVARDASDTPVVAATAAANELLLHVAGSSADYLAAATLRSVLTARRDAPDWREHEVARIPGLALAGWTRAPGDVGPDAWRNASPGDARFVWILVLILLGVETVVRRRPRLRKPESYADAA